MSVEWLADLPQHLRKTLDHTEFAPHHPELAALRADLEARTGHLVMTYRLAPGPPRPGTRTLCQMIEAADLTAADTATLSAAEARASEFGACLVAYRNPLVIKAGARLASTTAQRQNHATLRAAALGQFRCGLAWLRW